MKLLTVLACVLVLNSCNTCIGVGRDMKQGYDWCQGKIQGAGNSGNSGNSGGSGGSGSGAPVY